MNQPIIIERTTQPYLGIHARVAMSKIASVGDTLPGELFGWLGAHGLAPAGAPFFRYYAIDADGMLDLEWGVPLASPAVGDDRVRAGELPAGRYASLTHVGPYSGIRDATAALGRWIKDQGLVQDVTHTPAGDRAACWAEFYPTDPRIEPDQRKWVTEIAIKLAGDTD